MHDILLAAGLLILSGSAVAAGARSIAAVSRVLARRIPVQQRDDTTKNLS